MLAPQWDKKHHFTTNMALDKSIIETFTDPVLWCETYLRNPDDKEKPFTFRSYQKEIISNTRKYKNMVSRWGRRCVVDDTPIQMFDGTIKLIKDVNVGDKVVSKNRYGMIKEGKVLEKFDNGIMDVYKIYLLDGRTITCSKNHFLLTYENNINNHEEKHYKSIETGLKKGDKIVILKKYETYGNINSPEEAKLLGYLLTDGHIVKTQTPKFTGNNLLYIEEIKTICQKLFNYNCVIKKRTESNAYDIHLTDSNKGTTNKVKNWLESIDLLGKKEKLKNIYNIIQNYNKESLGLFLNRLWSGDGCISLWTVKNRKNGMRMESSLSSGNIEFLKMLQTFLYKFSISAKIKKDERICKFTNQKTLNYKLYFCDQTSIENFFSLTGLIYGKEKNSQLAIDEIKKREFKRIRNGRLNFNSVRIKNIFYIGKQHVYDISVNHYNNYITNGIVCHNSGKSVVFDADCLWWASAYPMVRMLEEKSEKMKPFRVLIFCPYETHVRELWNTFSKLIGDSALLKQQILKIRTSDHHLIEFKGQDGNKGSTIEGFTIGVSSSNQGTSIRGLTGDLIFIDEMDFIPPEIIEQVIIPITTSSHNTRLRVCSTPSGSRSKFFYYCKNSEKLGWFHSHIPSWHPDNSNWLSIEEAKRKNLPVYESHEFQVKQTTTSASFEREYGAEFGEEDGGVYKPKFIDRSLVNYGRYINLEDPDIFDPEFDQNPEHKYIIGVDWNTFKNGGHIVVVEFCTTPTYVQYFDDQKKLDVTIDFTGKYRLFYRRGIKSQEATQRLTRQEIFRLLTHYKIDYIYVDYGAGDTNIEELTLLGKDRPELHIAEKLVVIDAGAVVEHYDHILQRHVKKRNKFMMVNISVLSLEEGMIVLPKEEDVPARLVGQMRSYLVKNITTRGEPSYEGPDHILDAFNLAIYGFQQKFGSLLVSKVNFPIVRFNDPRTEMYPQRNSFAPIAVNRFGQSSYSMPIRDPERPFSAVKIPSRTIGIISKRPNINSRSLYGR